MNLALIIAQSAADRGSWWPDSWMGRFWVLFGLGAQAVFAGRFLVQWIASERRRKSHVPVAFWHLSIVGGVMLFAYAVCWKHDPVVAVGQLSGLVVYVRNLMLLAAERRGLKEAQADAADS
jgi:lipid-A-disaccharide synthase-like uncharacterized protein